MERKNKFEDFHTYLYVKNYTDSTIKGHVANISNFNEWVKTQSMKGLLSVNKNMVLHFVKSNQEKGIQTQAINQRLTSIRKYYEFLKHEGLTVKNPAQGILIKGKKKKMVHDVLSESELMKLNQNYIIYSDTRSQIANRTLQKHQSVVTRDKLIVSLMIHQGLHTGELAKLEIGHINMSQSTIYIPSTARSNSRLLSLHPTQVLPLYQYLNGLSQDQEMLFDFDVQQRVFVITKELKGINPRIKSSLYIRSSVIMNWVKKHTKRNAMYMVGHKHLSTTEEYKNQDTTELSELLEKFHPFSLKSAD